MTILIFLVGFIALGMFLKMLTGGLNSATKGVDKLTDTLKRANARLDEKNKP
jgi:hypothetical protein